MTSTIEKLKEISGHMLDASKINLAEHGSLLPVLMTVTNNEVVKVIGIPMVDNKRIVYGFLSTLLAAEHPDAAITINDSYMKSFRRSDVDQYRRGALALDLEARECIIVCFKGPAIPAHMLSAEYERNPVGDIVFKEEPPQWKWGTVVQMNLLPDWWTAAGRTHAT